MAKERREGEVCLPSDFLCDDHFLEEKRRRDDCFLEEFAMNLDWPAENECLCMTGLAWQKPGSFLGDTKVCCLRNEAFFPSHSFNVHPLMISVL